MKRKGKSTLSAARPSVRHRQLHAAVAISVLGCSMLIPPLHATECVELPQQEAFRSANLVFLGKVLRVEDAAQEENPVERATGKLTLQPSSHGGTRIVTFAVNRTWKGSSGPDVQLLTMERPTMFRVGGDYIVYALDEVSQDWDQIRRFSVRSKVYGIGFPCVLRVRADFEAESRRLDRSKGKK